MNRNSNPPTADANAVEIPCNIAFSTKLELIEHVYKSLLLSFQSEVYQHQIDFDALKVSTSTPPYLKDAIVKTRIPDLGEIKIIIEPRFFASWVSFTICIKKDQK